MKHDGMDGLAAVRAWWRRGSLALALVLCLLPVPLVTWVFAFRWVPLLSGESATVANMPRWVLTIGLVAPFLLPALVFVLFAAFDRLKPGMRGYVIISLYLVGLLLQTLAQQIPDSLWRLPGMLVLMVFASIPFVALLNLTRLLPARVRGPAFVAVAVLTLTPVFALDYSLMSCNLYEVMISMVRLGRFTDALFKAPLYTWPPLLLVALAAQQMAWRYLRPAPPAQEAAAPLAAH